MKRPRLSHNTPFLRLVSLIICYSLVSPFFALIPETSIVIAGTDAPIGPNKEKTSAPRKATQTAQKARWRDGELLVRFKPNVPAQDIDALLQTNGAQPIGQLRGQSGIERLHLPTGSDPETVATSLRSSLKVDFAEPNYLITADQTTPDDPRFSEQWALKNAGNSGGQFGSDINASQAWELTTGSKRTVIAVLDSGIDFTHPDLRNNEWNNSLEQKNNHDDDSNGFTDDLHGWDFVINSEEITDKQGHGTAVAGIIAAQGNNATGTTGVMWQASLMSLRILDSTGTGDVAHAVEAINYAVNNGAQIINCSWGTHDGSLSLLEAINQASNRGVLVVTSAGNQEHDIEKSPRYPASFDLDNLISVASTDGADLLTSFSNWGLTHVSIAAPGTDILTTKMGGDYQTISGTSASTAFVTGVAALVKTLRPWLGADRTREMILRGARPVSSLSDKVVSKGVVSAIGALGTLDTLPPSEGLDESGGNNGGEHGHNGSGRSNQRDNRPGAGNNVNHNGNRQRDGHEFSVAPLTPTPGPPGPGLPDLNLLRRQQPTAPKAAPPIPSTRCSHKDPNCDKGKHKAAIDAPTDLLAWASGISDIDSPLSFAGGDISDSPFSLYAGASGKQKTNPSTRLITLTVPYAALLMSPPPIVSYNAVTDFSSTSNPSGRWSYGYKTFSGSTFNPYSSNANLFGAGLDSWSQGYCCPMITRNATGTTYTYPTAPSVTQPTDLLNLHPGPSGERSVVRWTAPAAGTYTIAGRFQGLDSFGTTTDVAILHNSTSIFTGNVNGYGNQATFSVTRTVAAGDTIDFQVGYGSNSTYSSDSTGLAATIKLSSGSLENVIWTNVVGVTASGNSLSKPGSAGWDAGAVSTQAITSGDGYVEFTISETNTYRMCGLSNGDSSQSYVDIDFALYPAADGYLYIYQGGNYVGQFGTYSIGDRFRVAVEGGVVRYYKLTSGAPTLLYTSGVSPTYPLLVDTSLYSTGSQLANVVINRSTASPNVMWTNVVGVTPSGNGLSKPGADGWDTGAVSIQSLNSGDGYVEFTASETNTYRMCGLSNGDSNQSYTDIDFALYLAANGYVQVYEGGVYRGQFNPYSIGDHLRVAVEGGVIKYLQNGTVFYTSTVAPTYPLLVDTSLYSTGATISNVAISGTWANGNFSNERANPYNRTGSAGVDLLSRNINWSLPILGLKGRAGLDLGLSLSYNSLVWTKSQDGTSIKFDADQGMPGPGFRLGFPVIQSRSYNSQVGKYAYLLIRPSGSHTELQQVGTSNTYEAADSSYLQLIDNSGSLTVRPTDGSQLSYQLINGQYQCTQIKDRNGNYILVSYYNDGRINTVTDTLSRVVTFNYDAYLNLISITQSWGGATHTWATFGWSNLTLSTSFSGMTVIGPPNGSVIPVLTQVGFDDGSRYNFEYNSYAQVYLVRHYAFDNHQRSYSFYTLPASTTDCPRVTNLYEWVENWNNNQEAMTAYSTAGDYSSGQMTMPDGTIYKELFATTAWSKGLTTGTEYWSGGVKKKWTTAAYTQDDINLQYQKNPRVIETNIYDSDNNRKRTTIEYGPYAQWGLPYLVRDYAADGVTEIRHNYTDYNLNQAYLDRRIIGLVSAIHISNTAQWQTKIAYFYDASGDQLQATTSQATQHDASYGTGFTIGRGNVTAIARYDVTDINNDSKRLMTQIGYDTDGSVIFSRDPLNHQSNINYTDSFSDNVNRNTFAYPTTGTDADGYSSTTKYNYDFGAVMQTQTPPPAGQTQGPIQTRQYDGAGRISRIDNLSNGAWKYWAYPDRQDAVQTLTTINSTSPTYYQITVVDGAGRVRAQGGDLPNSTGLYSGQFTYYDVMGRVSQTSNPGEMTSGWSPAGEDAAGWVWTQQSYDWKGRPTLTTLPSTDGGQSSPTKLITYGGCGCAGGEVVTVRDEAGRQQRVTSDVLGRAYKTEILNWDGSPYSTVVNTYNARDQITNVKHYQGTEASGIYQESTSEYDAYGRLSSSHAPEQRDQNNQPLSTTYTYYADDATNVVTDARGATTSFSYNNRHQVTGISYSAPAGITVPAAVSFAYDAAGNRTGMTDGQGSVTYQYDQLSHLASETRNFTNVGSFTLQYGYNLGGEVTSVTDQWNVQAIYNYDHTGRLQSVTGAGGGASTYVSNMQYRAWGALKHLSYGNNLNLDLTYNNRLQTTKYDLVNAGSGVRVMGREYQYTTTPTSIDNDGSVKYSHDLVQDNLDRTYTYDHTRRLQSAKAGVYQPNGSYYSGPFEQTYSYDEWGNMIGRSWRTFGHFGNITYAQHPAYSETYVNNRNTTAGWQYDANGNLLTATGDGITRQYTYDAAGRMLASSQTGKNITQAFDGDGQRVKFVENTTTTFYVTSSVLGGQVISEVDQYGAKKRGYVYANGQVIAKQEGSQVLWDQRDLSGTSMRLTNSSGTVTSKVETDPLGTQVDDTANYNFSGSSGTFNPLGFYGDPQQANMGCTMDHVPTPCGMASASLRSGGSVLCPTGGCQTAGWDRYRGGFFLIKYDASGNRFTEDIGPGLYDQLKVPPLGGDATARQKAIFALAYREFRNRLNDKNCAAFFGGKDKIESALKNANFEVATYGKPTAASSGDYYTAGNPEAKVSGNNIFINSYGGFFIQNYKLSGPDGKVYDIPISNRNGLSYSSLGVVSFPTDTMAHAMVLLHELAHLVGKFGADFFPNDPQKTQAKESEVNDGVLQACFKLTYNGPEVRAR